MCDRYWPNEIGLTAAYGDVKVKLGQEDHMTDYTCRLLKVSKVSPKNKSLFRNQEVFGCRSISKTLLYTSIHIKTALDIHISTMIHLPQIHV